MRISDWSSDVCSSDLRRRRRAIYGVDAVQPRAAGVEDAGAAAVHNAHLEHAAAQPAVRRRGGSAGGDVRMSPLFRLRRRTRIAARHLARCTRGAVMLERSEEHTSELQSLMRISYAVF